MCISGSNFEPDMLFCPLHATKECDHSQNSTVTNVLQQWGQGAVMINFPSQLQECTACQRDQLRDVIFKLRVDIKWNFTADSP